MSESINAPPAEPLSALAADLHRLIGRFKRRLREQADASDLSPSQIDTLLRLSREGPMSITALAATESVRPQSMGATVAALEGLGHVQRAPDPTDGRQSIVSVTPRFEALLRDGRAARQDWLIAALQRALTPAEQAQLADAVELLARVVDA